MIRKCVQCTLLVQDFFAKIRLSIRRFTYVRSGPKRNSNCVQFMQFYGVGTLFATIINKGFIILRWKQSTSRLKMSRNHAPSQRGGFLVYSFLYQSWRAPALQQNWHNFRKFTIRDPLSFRFKQAFVLDIPVYFLI